MVITNILVIEMDKLGIWTTIRISKSNRDRLEEIGNRGEDMNDIVTRVLDRYEKEVN